MDEWEKMLNVPNGEPTKAPQTMGEANEASSEYLLKEECTRNDSDKLLNESLMDSAKHNKEGATETDRMMEYKERLEERYRQKIERYKQILAVQQKRQKLILTDLHDRVVKPIEQENIERQQKRQKLDASIAKQLQLSRKSLESGTMVNDLYFVRGGPARSRLQKPGAEVFVNCLTQKSQKVYAEQNERLVAIRLDIEHGQFHLRDTFTWNLYEKLLSCESFATMLCGDFGLPSSLFVPLIAAQMHEQISDYKKNAFVFEAKQSTISQLSQLSDKEVLRLLRLLQAQNFDTEDDNLQLREIEWMRLLTKLKETYPHIVEFLSEHISTDTLERRLFPFELPGELRCPIILNITVGQVQLVDRLEWDMLAHQVAQAPELIADKLCLELGLGGEFLTAIAHMIREQIYMYSKCLQLIHYPMDGSPVLDDEASEWFLEVLDETVTQGQDVLNRTFTKSLRKSDDRNSWTPSLLQLSEFDIQTMDKNRDRIARRKRRGVRGRRGQQNMQVDMFGFAMDQNKGTADGEGFMFEMPTIYEQPAVVQTNGANLNSSLILPDMKDPPKTNRSLLFKHGDRALMTGSEKYGPLTWLRKYSGVRSFQINAGPSGDDDFPSRRKGARAAAYAAAANISAIATSDMNPSDDPNNGLAPFKTAAMFTQLAAARARTPSPEVPMEPPPYSYEDLGIGKNWRCIGCGCFPHQTSSVRDGPLGEKSVCLACGEFYLNYKAIRHQYFDHNYPEGSPDIPLTQSDITVDTTGSRGPWNNPQTPVYPLTDKVLPESLANQRSKLHEKYPGDWFDVVQVGNGHMSLNMNVKVACYDCDPQRRGKLYALGPGTTIGNFENHLKNKAHRTSVEERIQELEAYSAQIRNTS